MPPEREDVDDVVRTEDARRREPSRRGQKLTAWQWAFRDRRTGRVSIASWPNIPLWIWIATAVARRMPFVHGRADTALAFAGSVALVAWGIGELWRGVNPWRRLLGFAVLFGMVLSATR
jgi:hypothetical protein